LDKATLTLGDNRRVDLSRTMIFMTSKLGLDEKVEKTAGDDALRESGPRMMACVRPYDLVGRYGGEEFLIVVPFADAMGTMGLAERIRRSIEAKPMITNSIPIAVTASFGVTASVDKSPPHPQEILRLVDGAR
jgi:two-component system cell cycle response regulator